MLLASLVLGVVVGIVGTDCRVFLSILPMSLLLFIVGSGTGTFASLLGGLGWFAVQLSVYEVALILASFAASLLLQRRPNGIAGETATNAVQDQRPELIVG